MRTAFVSLGSNLDNPLQQIVTALRQLEVLSSVTGLVCSRWFKSKPQGPTDQADFINACCRFKTTLGAYQLLNELQTIEKNAGRKKLRRWGERSIDLDLLYMDEFAFISSDTLSLPHPRFSERDFVLLPLQEVIDDTWPIDIEALLSLLQERFVVCPIEPLDFA